MDVSPLRGHTPVPVTSPGSAAAPPDAADRVAKEFEAMVVGQFMEAMFAGLDAGSTFGGGAAEKPWRSFMLQEYGKAIAEAGTLGIADLVREEVARLYAAQREDTP
ncbi:rod-binding protein [Azospirillum halopraeferens]|uniref:rod-binding protein n=1 Tax=Azospirillum halopraeferens TaxID=34010 RepID=UPI000427360A|nr:rod-binding protein [Azospirillum halopraeferens]